MLYEIFWLFYALGIVILITIGLWGIFFLQSIPAPRTKLMALVLSVIIILAGSYFSYQWNIKKREIRIFTQQVEEIGSEGGFVRPLSPPMIESGNPLHGIPIFV